MPSVLGIKIIKNLVPQWHKENRCVSETSASPSACVVNYLYMIGSSCVMKKMGWWVFVKNWKDADVLGWKLILNGRNSPCRPFSLFVVQREGGREREYWTFKSPPGIYLCYCECSYWCVLIKLINECLIIIGYVGIQQ